MESVIQTVLTMIILFGLCFVYLFYRLKLIQSGQSYTQQQNYLLQKKYEMAKASYQANAELYHDSRKIKNGGKVRKKDYKWKNRRDIFCRFLKATSFLDFIQFMVSDELLPFQFFIVL